MYEILELMPEEGHFVALWTYNNAVWTCTFKRRNGQWYKFDDDNDWITVDHPEQHIPTRNPDVHGVRYLVVNTEM